jgi:hypothetical protein
MIGLKRQQRQISLAERVKVEASAIATSRTSIEGEGQ